MKVDLVQYKEAFINALIADNVLSMDEAKETMLCMEKLLNKQLPCSHCKRVLYDKAFYKSKVHSARRKRLPVCKECHPQIYGSKNNGTD